MSTSHGRAGKRIGTGRRWRARLAALLLLIVTAAGLGAAVPGVASASPAFGTRILAGAQWLAGRGVDVFSNDNPAYFVNQPNYLNGVYVGVKWQCVELAQRLYTARGWHSGAFPGVGRAYQIETQASAMGMTFYRNGSGYVPVPGDMIVHGYSAAETSGHVSIVDTVNATSVGVVEQNWGNPQVGRGTYTRSGATLSRGSSVVRGVVHDPDNRPASTTLNFTAGLYDRSGGYAINTNPVHKQRTMYVQVFNSQNQLVINAPAAATQRAGASEYTGTISAPASFPTGYYTVKLRMDYTLVKQVDGIVTITGGRANAIPLVKPYVGDVNQDNRLDNTDYNLIVSCLGSKPCTASDKRGSDVDDNGTVDYVDVNLLQRQRFCNPGPCSH